MSAGHFEDPLKSDEGLDVDMDWSTLQPGQVETVHSTGVIEYLADYKSEDDDLCLDDSYLEDEAPLDKDSIERARHQPVAPRNVRLARERQQNHRKAAVAVLEQNDFDL